MDAVAAGEILVFEAWRFDSRARLLFGQDGTGGWIPVPISSRAMGILACLLERPGALVSKDAIMDSVWPDTAVEANNLTVQMAALRRVLDRGRTEGSCIQTIPGRGYRFAVPVRGDGQSPWPLAAQPFDRNPSDDRPRAEAEGQPLGAGRAAVATAELASGPGPLMRRRRRLFPATLLTGLGVAAVVLLLFGSGHEPWRLVRPDPPRLSLVVLPFENLSDDPKDDHLAEGITADLTSDLAYTPGASVVARASANIYKAGPRDVRKIGDELAVRYVLEGSVRRIGSLLRVNVQLVSAETGALLWSDRFDEQITDYEFAAGQEEIVARMRAGLGTNLVEIENARSVRERPANPDAFDLVLRARSLQHQPQSLKRDEEALALYEHALALDPSSVPALTSVAYLLIDGRSAGGWNTFEGLQRAGELLTRARAIAPESAEVLNATVYWLRSLDRCQEVIELARRAIQTDPKRMRVMTGVYNELGVCETRTGHAEEEIALQEKANELNPRSPWMFSRYQHLGFASLMLGRDQDAITFLQRSLAMKTELDAGTQWRLRLLSAAYARTGQMQQAQRFLSEADRLWPYDTVRSHFPDGSSSPVYADQIRAYQSALRLAGERDHADEDADFGVPADGTLHGEPAGLTPTGAPGVRTVRTADLVRLLDEARPVVIDTISNSWGRSIPGAVGLKFVGLGGSFTDAAQDHLRRKMRELTAGDLNKPVVAVGFNSERFDGRNLALRLAALGYTQVYWYRGGREAWEVNGLKLATLNDENW